MQLLIANRRLVIERIPDYKFALARRAASKVERMVQQTNMLKRVEQDRSTVQTRMALYGIK